MYPFLDSYLPDDFPPFILSFINWVILAHVAAFVFYLCGLAKDIFIGHKPQAPQVKKTQW